MVLSPNPYAFLVGLGMVIELGGGPSLAIAGKSPDEARDNASQAIGEEPPGLLPNGRGESAERTAVDRSASQFDDPLQPLRPKRPRSELDEDRIHAAALFATGRTLEQKGDLHGALRNYERSFRYDAEATSILREIVPLAFGIGRQEEALRYALIAVEDDPSDPELLRRLADHLVDQAEWKRAINLYEHLIDLYGQDAEHQTDLVLVQMEIGRLYFLIDELNKACDTLFEVETAMSEPNDLASDAKSRAMFKENASRTYLWFGECYLQAGRGDDAKRAFRKAFSSVDRDVKDSGDVKDNGDSNNKQEEKEKKQQETASNRGLLGYHLARTLNKDGLGPDALIELQHYFDLKLATEGTAPYHLFSKLIADSDEQGTKLSRLEALHENDPKNIPLQIFLAQQYQHDGQLDRAKKLYIAIVEANAALEKSQQRLPLESVRGLIEIYHQQNESRALFDLLQETVAQAGNLAAVKDTLKPLVKDTNWLDQFAEMADPQTDSAKSGTDYDADLVMADLALMSKRFELAKKHFDRSIEGLPDRALELLLSWGDALFQAEQNEAAAQVFERAIQDKRLPKSNKAALHFFHAGVLELSGKTEEALTATRLAMKVEPDSCTFAAREAWILYHANRIDEAIACYDKLIEEFDTSDSNEATRGALRGARLVMSNLYVEQNDYAKAEELLEQVLDEYPDDVSAMNDLGYLWVDRTKHLERAVRMIRRAVIVEPENRAYVDSLGWAYYQLGRYQEAVQELEKAASYPDANRAEPGEDHPDAAGSKYGGPDGVILDHLASAYLKVNRIDDALATWRRAIQAFEAGEATEKAAEVQSKIDSHLSEKSPTRR